MSTRGKLIGAGAAVVALAAGAGFWVAAGSEKTVLTDVVRTQSAGQCGKSVCWTCKGPVNIDQLIVSVDSRDTRVDAVRFAPGCTGSINNLVVNTVSGDGVKVAEGAHDLEIHDGAILCHDKAEGVHQDGIQVLGGEDITFSGLEVACPIETPSRGSLSHSCFFVNTAGASAQTTSGIVFEDGRCASAGATVDIATSDSSGVRDSVICPSVAVKDAFYVPKDPHGEASATNVVNEGNSFPDAC